MNILGVRPHLGRLLTPEEDQPGADAHKVVIGHSLWAGHFGGDPNVIGRVLRTDDTAYTVVGVMPPGFAFPHQTSMWAPIESQLALLPPERRIRRRAARFNDAIARVAPGITLAQAEADLNSVAAALESEYQKENAGVRVKLTAIREFETGDLRPYLYLLLAGVAMITLTCCANVAGLQLVRGMNRQREAALQAALGAGRGRLVRQRLAESAVLAAAGGALGIGLAMVIVNLMLALIPISLPFWMTIRIDRPVLGFAVVLTAATCVVFGLLPALRASQVDAGALKAGARLASAGGRLQSALVIGEVSLSVLLLVCAALLMQTLARLQRIDPGFTPGGLVTARVLMQAPPGPFPQHAAIIRGAHARTLDAIRRQPGVTAAAMTSALPFTGTQTERPQEPLVLRGQADKEVVAPLSGADVTPDYFRAMGIALRRGRLFDESDTQGAPHVVVINERGARTLWPDRDPLGQEMVWGVPSAVNPYARVVGIVADVHHQAAERDNGIELYYPLAQFPVRQGYYVVRVAGDPHAMADTIRRTIETSDRSMAVAEVKSMDQQIDESLWQRRLWGTLFSGFASLALLVAAVGLYGTVSYAVAQRTREFGIRVALGDRPARMGGMIVREGMMLVLGGVAIGIAGALGAGRLIARLLYGVPPHDLRTFVAVALVLVAAALVAIVIPARRASRIDPIVALRTE
jgi:putative ABC transport system permease protein